MYLFNEKKYQVQKHMFRSPWRDSVYGGFDQVPFFLFYIFCLMICNLLIYGTIYSTLYNKLLQAVTLFVVSWIATKCLYWNHNVMNMKRILHINFIQIYSWHQIIISSKYIESCNIPAKIPQWTTNRPGSVRCLQHRPDSCPILALYGLYTSWQTRSANTCDDFFRKHQCRGSRGRHPFTQWPDTNRVNSSEGSSESR